MLREKSIFFSKVEKEFPFQILLSFQQIISYYFIAIAEDGSLNIAGNRIFFFLPLLLQAWERLEKAEHERELALRNELIRQEKLEQLARRFDRKAAMRETWLSENQRLVSQVLSGSLTQVFLK